LAQRKIKIQIKDNYSSLSETLSKTGADFLIKTVKKYLAGKIKPESQNHKKAIICKLIKKEDGKLDFSKSAEILEREIRAYFPWPGSYLISKINNKNRIIKILEVKVVKSSIAKTPIGKFHPLNKKELCINCSKNALKISKLQIEGKNPISSKDFINGYLK